jgi:multiple sugar transport system substrate-binding protein
VRTINRRYGYLLGVPTIAALALTGCSGGTATVSGSDNGSVGKSVAAVTDAQLKGVTIKLARFFGDCSDAVGTNTDLSKAVGECPTITTLTNKFNAENKWGVKVERLGGASWDSYYDTLNTAISGGTPPDVAIMHGSSLVDYAKRGLLVPVDDLVGITHVDLSDAVPAGKTAISYNNATYAVPFDVHAALAHVNVDMFKKAGLVDAAGNPKLPASTDEFLADAQKMKQATGKNFLAIPRVGDELGVHMLESLLGQQGTDVLNPQGTESTLDSPQTRTALGFMDKIFNGYANGNQTYDAAQQSFLKGDAAMLYNGTWVVDQYNTTAKFKYRAMNFPTLYNKPAVWADSHTWVIPKQPKADPVKYRAALEFISFLYEHDKDWALGTGHISVRQSVLNSAVYKAAPQRATYADTGLTVAHPVPHIQSWPAVSKALDSSIESIWFQHTNVDQALKQGNSAINNALKNS